MKNSLLVLFLFILPLATFAQNITIPDANFKYILLNHSQFGGNVIDTNSDGEIQYSEAAAITILYVGDINSNVNTYDVADLTGIEAFVNLTELYCNNNNLTSLNLSQNSVLETLDCTNNQLTNLDLSQNPALQTLKCDLNQITSLDLAQNPNLVYLKCSINPLTNLNVSQNILLKELWCHGTQLTSLDLTQNSALEKFIGEASPFITLDLTQNTALNHFNCSGCDLTSLDVRNGNNHNVGIFATDQNPNLTCIFVDNAQYSQTNWVYVDAASTFVETQVQCNALNTNNLTFENTQVYPNPVHKLFYISGENLHPEKVIVYDMLGNEVKVFASDAGEYDISGLQKGFYFVKISNNKRSLIRKILKE